MDCDIDHQSILSNLTDLGMCSWSDKHSTLLSDAATTTDSKNHTPQRVSNNGPPMETVSKSQTVSPSTSSILDQSSSSLPLDDSLRLMGLKVLFLSSDTGGGHRASAESLARQFELLYPGSSYDILDLATETYLPPYNSIVPYYKHLSAHPTQWKILYGVSNSRAMDRVVETNIKMMTVLCERSIRKRIKSYNPDVVVSVHPLQTSVPILSCAKISHETGKHLPIFTVVTDLGSAHRTWFANGVEKMFVGSAQIYKLARERRIPEDKLVLIGLPIRHDFAIESEKLGDRMSEQGKEYQRQVRTKLNLPAINRKTLLVMGGGEGVGSLSNIVDALYIELVKQGINAVIMVVCGRNEKLKETLEMRNWDEVFQNRSTPKAKSKSRGLFSAANNMIPSLSVCGDELPISAGCIEPGGSFRSLRKILSSGSLRSNDSAVFIPSPTIYHKNTSDDEKKEEKHSGRDERKKHLGSVSEDAAVEVSMNPDDSKDKVEPGTLFGSTGAVDVVPLGFITNMAEYMVAADILISKAGPGTISEAAALSLPVMLTSFLPGQEEGNVDYVVEGGFGAFCPDTDPQAVAEEIALWLNDDAKLVQMSLAAKKCGAPNAARDIVKQIGDSTLKWRELNEGHASLPEDYGEQEDRENLSEIYDEEEQIADFIANQKPSEEEAPRSKDDSEL